MVNSAFGVSAKIRSFSVIRMIGLLIYWTFDADLRLRGVIGIGLG